ncbi:MAG: dimethyladenosine transferase [uncultured bacterium]|uniref:Ribosomal RNA small subunit methyltransferase A n=1 Tax=Candidatus Uhrbacteria bacterium GW2011_GWC1_41_20 TaxID=1618983 RepID=A0A0G0XPV7_9BACT|nr:MAG: dimethyladenosine transferase [uncultured bacterium]KKR22984.1 MAG: Ribosomal RNA small subunit methyltransferase A [Candidatus Uhrbacteria bacterium GW2011_GWE1_39_46]KKR63772.1 MAG: Ribosomal RNA small subunit methyltransferase A [Candidatus Uhrbacteria bacterium GW2011_GWC2_40_450]KKR89831.1 MAG: Ribosomal RNA small subunit methyltransferase A [Candidatus Uhrbacteria bacterium GW2011_GWD2_41_121]KKR95737.1 MAG: Ribosomal RNA small subunit methyltransferase A [Candidatus Uhrbacteria b
MKKSYGQHFLKDQSVIEKIIKSADLCSGDFVVEVGPGDGALTHQITCLIGPTSPTGLILIEADSDLLPNLRAQFISAQLIHADAAQVNIDEIVRDKPWIFISNLPYNSANAILMNMLTAQNPPERSVVMVQKEVGEKMLAKPGDMSLLSVAVQMYTNPTRVCTVKPGSFNPSPKVDSVVLRLDKKQVVENAEEIIGLAKIGFSSRRKQLHRNLADSGIAESQDIKSILESLGLSPTSRAQELSVEEWILLADSLTKLPK